MSKLSLIIVGTMCLAALFAVSDAALPCGVDSPLGFLDFSDLKLTGYASILCNIFGLFVVLCFFPPSLLPPQVRYIIAGFDVVLLDDRWEVVGGK